ncbi:MAG: hemK [Rickettsiaceae bacterium]|jgi:release factor glutamine methyltransferase|nr:hemK [Rickettsiaceae bacterium]
MSLNYNTPLQSPFKTEGDRLNRSFSRRIGKHLSKLQQNLLDETLPNFKIDAGNPLSYAKSFNKIFLEIGFGMGEHLINQANLNKDAHYIGCEPYMNGVANLLKLAASEGVNNFSVWPDDVDIVLSAIPNNSLDGVYILFPDPWPKNRQQKRRLANPIRMKMIREKLKPNGIVYFASDIYDYVDQLKKFMTNDFGFEFITQDEFSPHLGYIQTKYHSKAKENAIKPRFIQFMKYR